MIDDALEKINGIVNPIEQRVPGSKLHNFFVLKIVQFTSISDLLIYPPWVKNHARVMNCISQVAEQIEYHHRLACDRCRE